MPDKLADFTSRIRRTKARESVVHHELPALEELPAITYILPVLNEEHYLAAAVHSVLEQDYAGPFEVILALGQSSDNTNALAQDMAAVDSRIMLIDNPNNDVSSGMNLGIAASQAPVVIRVDAHSILPRDYTATAVEVLRRTGAANVGGIMAAEGKTPVQNAVARAYNSRIGLGGGAHHRGRTESESESAYLGVFRREVLHELGGYDPDQVRAQDWELNSRIRRAGYKVMFSPNLRVTYWPRAGLKALARQMFATGVWRGRLARKQRRTPLRYLAPPVLVVTCAISLAAELIGHRKLKHTTRAAIGTYLSAITLAGVWRLGGPGPRDKALNPVVLATVHLAWGAGFLKGITGAGRATRDRSRVT
jgi:GT2 family glycosyltransferase